MMKAPSGVCCVLCGYEENERERKKERKEFSRGLYTLADLPNPPYLEFEKLLHPLSVNKYGSPKPTRPLT
jgi:hypothetical protein